ncbi:uncharacterized protein LOC143256647 isoform X3 [Tachypleus tridentatus]|uniref:uncharacterized protein LOC143256647 isoform X3 n=1 Tax=Tachypleus tridentatus TaxID=6853 RepID=UPI003FD5F24B
METNGESWPINDTIWNEEEESVPSGIFIPKSDFALQKKSLKERIEDGFKSVFCCKHQTKQERIRVWCHDSFRSVRYSYKKLRNIYFTHWNS